MGSCDRFLHLTLIAVMTFGQLHEGSRGINKVDRTEPKKAKLLYPYRADGLL
jgi:hypothetical protein